MSKQIGGRQLTLFDCNKKRKEDNSCNATASIDLSNNEAKHLSEVACDNHSIASNISDTGEYYDRHDEDTGGHEVGSFEPEGVTTDSYSSESDTEAPG